MKTITVNSATELDQHVEQNVKDSKTVILLLTGTKNSAGKSWCPDCVVAEPVIEKVIQQHSADSNLTFITVPVGDLTTWRNSANQFRSHKKFATSCVPTLVNVNKNLRLEEGGCADQSLVDQLFKGTLANPNTTKAGTCEGGVCRIR